MTQPAKHYLWASVVTGVICLNFALLLVVAYLAYPSETTLIGIIPALLGLGLAAHFIRLYEREKRACAEREKPDEEEEVPLLFRHHKKPAGY